MPSSRDLADALASALPGDRYDLPLVIRVGGVDVPVSLDRLTVFVDPTTGEARARLQIA